MFFQWLFDIDVSFVASEHMIVGANYLRCSVLERCLISCTSIHGSVNNLFALIILIFSYVGMVRKQASKVIMMTVCMVGLVSNMLCVFMIQPFVGCFCFS